MANNDLPLHEVQMRIRAASRQLSRELRGFKEASMRAMAAEQAVYEEAQNRELANLLADQRQLKQEVDAVSRRLRELEFMK